MYAALGVAWLTRYEKSAMLWFGRPVLSARTRLT